LIADWSISKYTVQLADLKSDLAWLGHVDQCFHDYIHHDY